MAYYIGIAKITPLRKRGVPYEPSRMQPELIFEAKSDLIAFAMFLKEIYRINKNCKISSIAVIKESILDSLLDEAWYYSKNKENLQGGYTIMLPSKTNNRKG